MNSPKPKTLENIEQKMGELDESSLRYHVLDSAKNFKTSWIELGRSLYAVMKDKLYKEWGYSTFDIYSAKEIGIRKQTAMKLLRSYYFLEKEEPAYLTHDYAQAKDAAAIPSYESVDILRQAKAKKIDDEEYAELKSKVFDKGTDSRAVKKDLTALIRQRKELDPEEARQEKRGVLVRRFLGTLKSLKRELEVGKMVPAAILKDVQELIRKLEEEI